MYFLYLLIAILFFGILIAVHEFGHFATAKLTDVKVNEFAIGMGPTLVQKQKGETLYSWRLLPIGGYCAMEGEDEETGDPRAFSCQKAWKKLLILVAGSFMNFLFGLLISLLLMTQVTAFTTTTLADLMDGFPHEGETGLMVGDEILEINGKRVYLFDDVTLLLGRSEGTVDFVVRRDGEKLEINGLPLKLAEYEYNGETGLRYGFVFERKEATAFDRLRLGWYQTLDFVRMVGMSLGDLLSGDAGLKDMSGVIGIVDTISSVGAQSQTVMLGLINVLYFVAFIAVNLAVMNLLPIPALDGGRIFFVIVNGVFEVLTHKRIPSKYEGYVHTVGFVLLLALMAIIAVGDVWKLVA